MKTTFSKSLRFLFAFVAASCAVASSTLADEARFFRVAGPVPTSITAVSADGYVTWTNVATNATFTVQTATSLLSNWVSYVQVPASTEVTTSRLYDPNPPSSMVLIPAGSFTMGDTLDGLSDAVPISVTVSAFYMDTNLVSYSQWQAVFNWATNHGYAFYQSSYSGPYVAGGKATNHPVQTVDWYDGVKWCNARSVQAGLTPVYYTNAGLTQVFTNGDSPTTVYQDLAANGYRLPTEAEWEKAARGGLSEKRFPWGNTISESQANYYANPSSNTNDLGPYSGFNTNYNTGAEPYTSPVGSFAPNGYGLYDMAGNVFEWCWDWYGTPYGQPTTTNPTGAGPRGYRVLRGGAWLSGAYNARCAYRGDGYPNYADYLIGFRCVRGL